MAARRRDEAMASLACLSVSQWDWMGLPEGEWPISQLTERLTDAAGRFAPDIIYAPSRVDFHPEHWRVAHGLASTLSTLPSAPLIRVYQIQVPLTSRLVNLRVDVTSTRTQDAARRTYVKQADSVVRTRRMRRYASAYYGASGEVEEFWQMSAETYRIRHRDDPEGWALDPFRGIRWREWTDPLAYWHGRFARRQLADLKRSAV